MNYHHFVFPLEVSRSGLKLFKPPQKRGEGCERLTVFMQSRVPLGPGKFHVVVLVILIAQTAAAFQHNRWRKNILSSVFDTVSDMKVHALYYAN